MGQSRECLLRFKLDGDTWQFVGPSGRQWALSRASWAVEQGRASIFGWDMKRDNVDEVMYVAVVCVCTLFVAKCV